MQIKEPHVNEHYCCLPGPDSDQTSDDQGVVDKRQSETLSIFLIN